MYGFYTTQGNRIYIPCTLKELEVRGKRGNDKAKVALQEIIDLLIQGYSLYTVDDSEKDLFTLQADTILLTVSAKTIHLEASRGNKHYLQARQEILDLVQQGYGLDKEDFEALKKPLKSIKAKKVRKGFEKARVIPCKAIIKQGMIDFV